MTATLPEPPKAAGSWLDLLDKANRLNVIPILLAATVVYFYWADKAQARADLAAAESRTREALSECRASASAEHKRTREEVRAKAADLKRELAPVP
jgi:hypothetical protein